ncbi:MAG: hypothetical protein A3H57_01390 [Candidatus Taylorbacteria bacterium RIFCSPLOWO2_02_FULL_43_11]|uniref:Glycosyltransferase 2-like domain-containing protein n=1 Tax=Candidatus Taylorbacteria bacterium RIFCSPHIGHO2_02_FULL_43_32b TaxID=1802306 RepID=A0A1G2MLJ0_9BACT|nr:MAG: hypothetical protein A3C72_01815 [Candidatus Taylorbacteria bacterium RIFCSPHIGHO2_02_FULL_43_32b]OHA35830.1 MAG: hypothetical protein A3H57_01390 [Candidatus Taylorbacteria bacterium RIFCSPLOWO2_02_FULL_43_11]
MKSYKPENLKNISLVICVRNSANLLHGCLTEIKKESPESEVIVIDGNSRDNSASIAKNFTLNVFSDEGKGLAAARQLGIDKATRSLVAFVGPDNIISRELLLKMANVLLADPMTAAVVANTKVINPKNYWEKTTNYIYEYLINKVGSVDVVGTPCMYPVEIVRKIRYDSRITGGCDDTDLSFRLKDAGYKLEMIDSYNYEKNDLEFKDFCARWKTFYGRGDAEFYNKYKDTWTFRRKFQSLTHPLRKYILKGSWIFIRKGKFIYVPGIIIAGLSRYLGWYIHYKKTVSK